jgi:hypothetical protein
VADDIAKEPLGRTKRTRDLDPDLVKSGFSRGWAFCIPAAFRRAVDIHLTSVVEKGKASKIWTQGRNFSFEVGDTLYDSRDAYGKLCSESISHIKTCLEVVLAIPANGHSDGTVEFLVYHSDGSELKLSNSHRCSQVEFVALLKTGSLGGVEHIQL